MNGVQFYRENSGKIPMESFQLSLHNAYRHFPMLFYVFRNLKNDIKKTTFRIEMADTRFFGIWIEFRWNVWQFLNNEYLW